MKTTVRILTGMAAVSLGLLMTAPWAFGQGRTDLPTTQPVQDADAARRQSDDLLKRAKQAITERNYQGAELLIRQAESLGVTYPPLYLGDTPAKMRRMLDAVRSSSGAAAPSQTPFDARGLNGDDPKSLAKTYVRNGRLAMAKGNYQEAFNWYRAASGVPVVFSPDEDSPAKLGEDLRRMGYDPDATAQGGAANQAPVTPLPSVGQMTSMTPPGITPESKSPAQKQSDQWLLEARRALALGDVKTAQRYIEQVRSLGLTYGRFEDSPERVETMLRAYQDLMSQKDERGQTEAWRRLYAKLLVEQADGLLRWGDLNEAERLARHALQQGVNFSPFELKPETILDRVAEEMRRRSPVSVPAADTAPGYAMAAKQRAADLLSRARAALNSGDWSTAETYAMQAASFQLPESAFGPGEDSPNRLLAMVQQAKAAAGVVPTAGQSVIPASGNYGAPNVAAAAVYNPAADITRNMPASAAQPGLPSGPFQAQPAVPGRGMMLVRQAEEALQRNDVATATEYFRQATAYFAELDPATVQRVQDYLQQRAARTSYQAEPPSSEVAMQQQMLARQLSAELAQKESQALSLRDTDPDRSRQILDEMRGRIQTASVDAAVRDQLLRRLDARLAELDRYVQQNQPILDRQKQNAEIEASVTQERLGTFDKQSKLAEMVQEYNQLIRQQRFAEAEVVAKRAAELDPDNPVTQQLVLNARFIRQYSENMALKDEKEQAFLATLASVDQSSIPFDDSKPFLLPDAKEWKQLTDRRAKMAESRRQRSEKELEIERKLSETPVVMQFQAAPLARVIEHLGKLADINVHIDPNGLATEGVSTDTPVTINLSQEVSLKSALNLVLEPLHLSYVIKDDVLKITSEQLTRGEVYTRAYDVADLVSPIPNFIQSGMPLDAAYANAMRIAGAFSGGPTPNTVLASRGGERVSAVINPSILAQMSQSTANAMPGGNNVPFGAGAGAMGGAALADFDSLIELIQTTVDPTSWDAQGGPGSISPFPTNLSLVISNTQEVHEQITDLLEQLRRMQDLQVTVEVRFITLNDNFFERIGVDFDFDIDDKIDGRRGVQFGQIVTPADPANNTAEVRNLTDKDSGKGVTVGMTAPVGLGAPASFSADLDIPFRQGSFALATPQFGGYDGTAGAQLGFAILSEIEAYFFIEAAQGDRRSNVLQAPKVTLYNGQYASVSDQSISPFVMGIIPVVGDFAAAQQPVVVMVSEGTFLTVQAVVSQDRRFVRMTVIPYFARIQDVNQFTFTGSETTTETTSAEGNQTTPNDNTKNSRNRTTTKQGSTVQLPTVASVSVNTTVSVPDGGTVLLGGIKRLSEGRNEFGVPMLSKIPYVNRLFKNASVGRETQSLMMMVTPRIIIPEEEEEKLGITTP